MEMAQSFILEPFPEKRTQNTWKKQNESLTFGERLVHAA